MSERHKQLLSLLYLRSGMGIEMSAGNIVKEYKALDVARMFFCICIVFLHSGAYHMIPYGEWYVLHGLLRLAVPFFFVVSGFFWGRSIRQGHDLKGSLIRYEKRLCYPYLVFSLINIVLAVTEQLLNGERPVKVALRVIRSVVFYPYGALWYVWACMTGAFLLYWFLKRERLKQALVLGGLLYFIALLLNSYYFLIGESVFGRLADIYLKVATSARNGVFVGFLYMGLGVAVAYRLDQLMEKRSIRFCSMAAILSWAGLFLEAWFIRGKQMADDHSLFFSFVVLIPALVVLLLHCECNIKSEWALLCRNLSAGVYFLHRASLMIITVSGLVFQFEVNRMAAFVLVLAVDILICLWSYQSGRRRLSMLLR